MNAPINPAVAAAIAAAKEAEDQSKVQKGGGGEYKPPAAGPTFGRLVSYLELGKENYDWKGQPKTKNRVRLVFELIDAKKHPPIEYKEGEETKFRPVLVTININKSFGENGSWRKLFARLNSAGDITHAAEALGRAFKLVIHHNTDKNDDKIVYANLHDETGAYTIFPATIDVEDPENPGSIITKPVAIGEAKTPLKCFIWDFATKEMWDSIFIDGSFPAQTDDKGNVTRPEKSRNVLQQTIKEAANYVGSPIYNILQANGDELEVGDAEKPARPAEPQTDAAAAAAGEDPLAGV